MSNQKIYQLDIVQDELKELLQRTDRALYALASCTTTEPCPVDCPYTDCWYDGSQKLLEDCRDLLTKYRAKQTPMVVNVTKSFPSNKYGLELRGGKCPSCEEEISDNVSTFFCKYCGQKLEWNRQAIGSEQNG